MKIAKPVQIFRWHLSVITLLASAHIGVMLAASAGHKRLFGLHRQFSLLEESNIPTSFAALALLAAGIGAAVIGQLESKAAWRRGWRGLAICLVVMSLDEAAQVHEMFSLLSVGSLRGDVHGYNWVVAYAAITLVVGGYFLKFWLGLPRDLKVGLALGGGIFVASALGLEIVESVAVDRHGFAAFYMPAVQAQLFVEEVGEMLGIAVINYTVLKRLQVLQPQGIRLNWRS